VRVAAAPALTGRYAFAGRPVADALAGWAAAAGAEVEIVDGTSDPVTAAGATRALAPRCDLLLGPYGSGHVREAARAMAGTPWPLWNHGGAAARPSPCRQIDVLAPAGRYWDGLPELLARDGLDLGRVAILAAPSGFGRAVADGLVAALARSGARPLLRGHLTEAGARTAAEEALGAGAVCVVGCGRLEDDLALGRALAGAPVAVALVACGVAQAAAALGDALTGWLGPVQWPPGAPAPPGVPGPLDYPAAQAVAAAVVGCAALAAGGDAGPDALWDAARSLRMRTHLGPFAVDAAGCQTAAAPALVRWVPGPDGPVRRTVWTPDGGGRA
jgi:ABC-type branched-subunit amino acid transport system substrate-binding protein